MFACAERLILREKIRFENADCLTNVAFVPAGPVHFGKDSKIENVRCRGVMGGDK